MKKYRLLLLTLLALSGITQTHAQTPAAPDGMVRIPAGDFWMGRTFNWLLDELNMHLRPRLDDQPVHLVYLDSFWIDANEISNEKYLKFAEDTHRKKPFHWIGGKIPAGKEKFPVYNVTWDDATAFCQSAGKRLPTEAEWERAARGGMEKAMYPWGAELRAAARRGGNATEADVPGQVDGKKARFGYPNGPTAVGSYAPNGFGLYDVTGNVWEWVNDWYQQDYYSVSPDKNPPGPKTGRYRVIRGGGWSDSDERILAVHYRNFTNQDLPSDTVGFRCARSQ